MRRLSQVHIFLWNCQMKRDVFYEGACRGSLRHSIVLLLCLLLAACATRPGTPEAPGAATAPAVPRFDGAGPEPVLNYYQALTRMTATELLRERAALTALPANSNTQVRAAMVLGLMRGPQDLSKAIALLDGVMKSTDPNSISLQPLARLLADNYLERQKLEAQGERLAVQSRENQRRAAELQEKIDRLTEIERSLPSRSRPARTGISGSER